MFFAARETVERWAADKDAKARAEGRKEGISEGRKEGISEGREQGIFEGREQGIFEGREQGIFEGREQGISEGREQGRQEIVALLKEHDVQLPTEVLCKLNGDEDSDDQPQG